MSVITATDPDHLDIYGTKEAYLESFRHYTTLIQPGSALILHNGLEMQADVQPGVTTYTLSLIHICNSPYRARRVRHRFHKEPPDISRDG